ncbi:MAG: rhodanese-like domain-containing protein [Thermodesulfobacteriota bacterium]
MRAIVNSVRLTVAVLLLAALAAGCSARREAQPVPDHFYKTIVDAKFVSDHLVVPAGDKAMLIDSRPYETKYVKGHLPTAVSLPDSKFDELAGKLLPKDKNVLLIFYCEGPACKLSHNSARKAEKLGYANVAVYAGGFPDWVAAGRYPVYEAPELAAMMASGQPMLVVDSRPADKYREGSVPGAVSIPDTFFEKYQGMLPADKDTTLVFFCGGLKCPLSHKSALKAQALGYKKVATFEAGYPGWVEAFGAGTSALAIKSGKDEGTMDVEQFKKVLAEKPQSILLVDVRDADEFARGHFAGAVNMPVGELQKNVKSLSKDKPIVFTCATGARSGEAFYMVKDLRPDIKDVYYLEADVTCQAADCTIKAH